MAHFIEMFFSASLLIIDFKNDQHKGIQKTVNLKEIASFNK